MNYLAFALAAMTVLSLALSVAVLIIYRRLVRSRKRPAPDLTAADLLHDLTQRGMGIIRVEVIDPANLLLRSPRR